MRTVAKVYELNELFANHQGLTLNYEDLRSYMFGQNDGVREELEELEEAQTINEALDAYGDYITFADGMLFKAGVPLLQAVEMENVLSKSFNRGVRFVSSIEAVVRSYDLDPCILVHA